MASAAPSLDSLYPQPPADAPPDLAKATASYRFHAWLALMGLFTFAVIYLALTGWFTWSAYRLFTGAAAAPSDEVDVFGWIKGAGAALLALFMIKGLFFRKPSGQSKEFEIERNQEPRLFEFLDRIADETKAPRAHRVFLSPDVNACVFYDLSIWNFFFAGKKNLNIGLGLVNVLSLSEFKAVLAHEFGHFAQSSMGVGRWVYVAQQVATQVIYHRDFLDKFLLGLSRFDLRLAWIGWLLRLVIWAIRSILDTMLSLVMLAERALSREMEFQADLVAVKSTGSDALIHGLYRLGPADAAWEEAKNFIGSQLGDGHATRDFFAIQTRVLQHRRHILNDPDYGSIPPLPANGRDSHRVFTADLAQPPQMWSTHPQSHLREENAKQIYVHAELRDESAWCVFKNPAMLRLHLSGHVINELNKPERPLEESIAALDESYAKHCFDPRYRGAYLGRSIVDYSRSSTDLFNRDPAVPVQQFYPPVLTDLLEKNRNLQKEKGLLTALRDRAFEPADGVIRFRGKEIKRRDLGDAIETVDADLAQNNSFLEGHDRACRDYHLTLANAAGNGWPEFLRGSLALLHYAEHSLRNLADADTLLGNTWAVVIADGQISKKETTRLVKDASGLHRVLKQLHKDLEMIRVDGPTTRHLSEKSYAQYFEPLRLPRPDMENLPDWMPAVSGWVGGCLYALSELRAAALETLLETEKMLAANNANGAQCPPAPVCSTVPNKYQTLLPSEERKLQTKLGLWDSFQTASGFFPSVARLAVAAAIVVGAIYITLPPKEADRRSSYQRP